jgi:endoglucanase
MDNGLGSNAYTSNHYYGWDWVVSYGTALNTTNAVATANWVIKSTDDASYGTTGKNPTNCYRKSKLNGMSEGEWNNLNPGDYNYNYTMEHTIYLKLPYSMVQGSTYTIQISNTNSDTTSKTFTFDIFNSPSEAVHVNLVGYLNDASVKAVDLYIWLGKSDVNDFRDYSGFVGKKVYIYNVNTSASQQVGTVAFWKTSPEGSGSDVHYFNLTMSTVWTADFTGFNTPGTYRAAIEGVG